MSTVRIEIGLGIVWVRHRLSPRLTVALVLEPENAYDRNAIAVYATNSGRGRPARKVG